MNRNNPTAGKTLLSQENEDKTRDAFMQIIFQTYKISDSLGNVNIVEKKLRKIKLKDYELLMDIMATDPRMDYKVGVEKVIKGVKILLSEYSESRLDLFLERAERIYNIMYAIKAQVTSIKDQTATSSERFERIKFTTIKGSGSGELLLDKLDIETIKSVGKSWIYNSVNSDKQLFVSRIAREARAQFILLNNIENQSAAQALLGR